tara:strand:+ start:1997 stop:2833 length:837 start_codon:yes stop_codon:yes gene_type:complete
MDKELAMLAAGAALGLVIAGYSLLTVPSYPLSDDIAALVNEVPISQADHQSRIQRLAAGGAAPDALRQSLEALVDEELLIQRAEELNLTRLDPNVRTALLVAARNAAVSEQLARPASEQELRAFFTAEASRFTTPLQLTLECLVLADDTPVTALAEIRAAFTTSSPLPAALAMYLTDSTPLPPVPLSLTALHRFLPAPVIAAAAALPAGETAVVPQSQQLYLIKVVTRANALTPAFDAVRTQVEIEYGFFREHHAFANYLQWLRDRAQIQRHSLEPVQ